MLEMTEAKISRCKAASPEPGGVYRWFFISAIAVVLTAGATWGTAILWQIAMLRQFTGVSLYTINAHGSAQIFGWVGLFVMGFAYQAFPRMWETRLVWPRASYAVLIFTLEGIALTALGMPLAEKWVYAAPVALAGAMLHVAAASIFATQIVLTFRKGNETLKPYVGFIFAALFWFVAMSIFNAWHTWTTMTAPYLTRLLWYVATYQAPLRDMQIHGLILCMILGVSMRKLPLMYGLPPVSARRGWTALALLTFSVAAECILFVAYRWSGNHILAAFLMIPWMLIATACAMIVLPWKLWRQTPRHDRSTKFIRIAYAWLGISLIMLLAFPAYMHAVGLPFSHAYYGAIRHAITVGFVSIIIMGFASKIIPRLNGIDASRLSNLWVPFILINVGCFLRVSTQTLTDINRGFYSIIGISGVLELTALTWWAIPLLGILLRKKVGNDITIPRPVALRLTARVGPLAARYEIPGTTLNGQRRQASGLHAAQPLMA